jgi:hypothetical protein
VYRSAMSEHLFDERTCLDCKTAVLFTKPGDVKCPSCGLGMYLTESGQVGRYPSAGWEPGGIQGRR